MPSKAPQNFKLKFYTVKELQLSIAVLAVIALLSGLLLQSLSSVLVSYMEINTVFMAILLVAGYALIVLALALFFSHRLVGPFKRLEYEMKLIKDGDFKRRLSVRSQDDLHVRDFIRHANEFITDFEKMNDEHSKLNLAVADKLEELSVEISKDDFDCEAVKSELYELILEAKRLRSILKG